METPVDDSLQSRMIRAARLDPALYDEVKDDPRALPQATFVVVLSALATGIGFGEGELGPIALGMLFALLGWWFAAYLAYFIGTRLLPESKTGFEIGRESGPPTGPPTGPRSEPTPGGLLRTVGFSSSPGIARMLAVVPELRWVVILATTVWMICASVIAIRQGLSYHSTARAAGVYFAIQLLLVPLVLLLAIGDSPVPVDGAAGSGAP